MSSKKIAEFPKVEAKLQKPTKQSAFERKKAEAEAKRQREAAETAAVYEDFVKSFERSGDGGNSISSGRPDARSSESRFGRRPHDGRLGGPGGEAPFGGGASKRHFGIPSGPSMKSGPGSLGPPPSAFSKKRFHDGAPAGGYPRDQDEGEGRLGPPEDREPGYKSISKAFNASDDDEEEPTAVDRAEEKAISRPTLRLADLPPTTSPAVIKALIPSNLVVENVKMVPPPPGAERKSTTAIVTLSKETPATEIDAAVSTLQNRYLGFGFYLSLHRHLSSAAISSTNLPAVASSAAASQPFGAKRVESRPGRHNGPPSTGFGRRFAPPPPSYSRSRDAPINSSNILHVPIKPPRDVKQLRMIHKVVEAVLEHGPEFEALLMSRTDVQRQERWAWIWDARSEGGIWYRWRLWEIATGIRLQRGQAKYLPLFEDSHAWKVPEQPLSYEYATAVGEFVSDSEYNSSDEDELDEEQNKQQGEGGGSHDQEDMFLSPIEKARMAHLLARLPTTLSKVRKGDIARVATFAITHASKGSDEIAEMIVSNIDKPFAYTSANPHYSRQGGGSSGKQEQGGEREESPATAEEKATQSGQDASAARLIGLYVVSDILSSSSTSGIRHAWRYRQLLEAALRSHKTFETLGMAAEKYSWGRLRAEKWKRSIGLVLGLWEGWCVFPIETHEFFVRSFEDPPQLKKAAAEKASDDAHKKAAGRWKTVETAAEVSPATAAANVAESSSAGPPLLPVSRKPQSREASPAADEADKLQEMLETGGEDGDFSYYSYGGDYSGDDDDSDDPLLSGLNLDGVPVTDDEEGADESPEERRGINGVPSKMSAAEPVKPAEPAEPTKPPSPPRLKSVGGFQVAASKPVPSRKRMRAVDMFADSGSDNSS